MRPRAPIARNPIARRDKARRTRHTPAATAAQSAARGTSARNAVDRGAENDEGNGRAEGAARVGVTAAREGRRGRHFVQRLRGTAAHTAGTAATCSSITTSQNGNMNTSGITCPTSIRRSKRAIA